MYCEGGTGAVRERKAVRFLLLSDFYCYDVACVYVCVCVYVCMCVHVCACVGERGSESVMKSGSECEREGRKRFQQSPIAAELLWVNRWPTTHQQAVHTNPVDLSQCSNEYTVGNRGDTELGLEGVNRSLVLWVVEWIAAGDDNTQVGGSTMGRR